MRMNVKLSDANLTRLAARVENGTYKSLDAAANALITKSLDLELPEAVKQNSAQLEDKFQAVAQAVHLDTIFQLIVEEALKCTDMTPFPVSRMIKRLPKDIQENLTSNMRRLLGARFFNYAAKVDVFRRVGYSSPAVYINNHTFSFVRKSE